MQDIQAEDIIASYDEADHVPPTKPPHIEFMKCLEVVARCWSFDHGPDSDKFLVSALQMQACAIRKQPTRTQTTIESFFYTTRIVTIFFVKIYDILLFAFYFCIYNSPH